MYDKQTKREMFSLIDALIDKFSDEGVKTAQLIYIVERQTMCSQLAIRKQLELLEKIGRIKIIEDKIFEMGKETPKKYELIQQEQREQEAKEHIEDTQENGEN